MGQTYVEKLLGAWEAAHSVVEVALVVHVLRHENTQKQRAHVIACSVAYL